MDAVCCRYAAVTHEPEHVLLVDKVLAWSVGEYYHAEVDICLAPDSASVISQLAFDIICTRIISVLGPIRNHIFLLYPCTVACFCDRGRMLYSATTASA